MRCDSSSWYFQRQMPLTKTIAICSSYVKVVKDLVPWDEGTEDQPHVFLIIAICMCQCPFPPILRRWSCLHSLRGCFCGKTRAHGVRQSPFLYLKYIYGIYVEPVWLSVTTSGQIRLLCGVESTRLVKYHEYQDMNSEKLFIDDWDLEFCKYTITFRMTEQPRTRNTKNG